MPGRKSRTSAFSKSKKTSWDEKASLLRAASHPVRLVLLKELSRGPRCVKELNKLVPIAQPHLSQHMSVLRRAGLVDFFSEGNLRCYYLTRPSFVKGLIRLLEKPHPVKVRSKESVKREISRRSGRPR